MSLSGVQKTAYCNVFLALILCATTLATAQSPAATRRTALTAQLHEATRTAQAGDANRALELTNSLLAEHPEFEPAIRFQGDLLAQMGRGPEARVSYEKALKLAPGDPELMLQCGIYDLIAGDKDKAIALFDHRLKLIPRDGDTLYYLAQAYHLAGNNDAALKTIRECLKAEPDNASVLQKYGELLYSSGDGEASEHWLLKAQQADPTLDKIDFDLALANYKNQQLDSASQYATKAVERRPNDLIALGLLGAVDVKLAMWQQAEPVFERILAVKSDDPAALLGLGHCELQLKDYPQAANSLERLLQKDPTQIEAHFYLSRAYMALGRTADAEHQAELHSRMLQQAAGVTPKGESEIETATLQQARQMLKDGHESAALDLIRSRAKGPYATPGEPYMLVGALYLYMGRTDDAVRYLNKAMTIDPSVRGAHTYLGIMALQQDDLDKAEAEFKAELAGAPNYQLAVAELGAVRYRQARWADAADLISRSRTVEPSSLYMLCDSYFHLGKVKEADLTAELLVDYGKGDRNLLDGVIDLLNRNQQTELAQSLATKIAS
jgi:predicted Zn-dependent protease